MYLIPCQGNDSDSMRTSSLLPLVSGLSQPEQFRLQEKVPRESSRRKKRPGIAKQDKTSQAGMWGDNTNRLFSTRLSRPTDSSSAIRRSLIVIVPTIDIGEELCILVYLFFFVFHTKSAETNNHQKNLGVIAYKNHSVEIRMKFKNFQKISRCRGKLVF